MSEFDFSDAVNPFAQNSPSQDFDFKDAINPFAASEFTRSISRVDDLEPQPRWMVNHLAKQPKARSFTDAAVDTGRGVMKSLAGVADAAMHTADFVDDAIPLGGLAWEEGDILPSYKTPVEYQAAKEQSMATPTDATGQAMDYWEQGKSAAIKQDAQYLADADGFADTFKRAAERPRAIGNAIADSIGYMVPGMAAARAAKVAGATGAGVAGAVAGTGAVVEGGAARSQAVGEVMDMPLGDLLEYSPDYQSLIESGVSPEGARMRVAADAGFTAQAIAMPVSLLASKLTGAAKAEAEFFTGQGAKDFFTGLFRQAGEEAAQEVGSQFGVNVGVAENADNRRDYSDDLGNAAAMGVIMGPAQQAGMKAIDVAGQQLRSIGPVSVQDDGEIDLPQNGEEIGGGIVDDLPQESSEQLQLGHNPQRMIVMPDGTTAWENEIADLPAAAGMQPTAGMRHPGYARLSETPDEIEKSLAGDVDIDAELAELMADLDRAESIAREATPMMAPGVNPFDQFDVDAQPDGLFDGIRQAQAEQQQIARANELAQQEMASANFQEDDERGFLGQVARLSEQSRYEPVMQKTNVDQLAEIYPPNNANDIPQEIGLSTDIETVRKEDVVQDYPQAEQAIKTENDSSAITLENQVDLAASEAATSPLNDLPEPTEAQKEAGNYKKAHVKIQGLDISIENPRGSTRSGTDNDGNAWSVKMHNHYGYIKRTEGADGDHVDVFIGPNPDSEKVFIVDQVNADGSFDEHKVLMAFDSKLKARSGYKSNYSNGWKVGPITSMSMDEFKDWVKNGDTKKPLSSALIASQLNEQKPGKIESTSAISESQQPESESKTPKSESNDAAPPVKDSLTPEILTESKNKYLGKMARERGIKKGSPGYADALKKVEADYEVELDRAQAALPFEEFNRLNSDSPKSVNRQAWEALREEYGTDDMRYSLGEGAGITVDSAQAVIDEIRKVWKNPHIKIEAVENIDGMPEPIKARILADKVPNEKVKAVYHNGAVYVNASAMVNALDVERAVFHEVHGHYGARAMFGKDTSLAMGRLYLAIGGEKGIRDIAKKHSLDLSKYEQILKGESPGKRAEIMADELLAHIAQDSKPSIKRWLQELIGTIRTWLRAHGFTGLGKFSDSEIMALLKRTREAATELKLDGGSVLRVLLDVAGSDATADTAQAAYSLSGLPPKTRKVISGDPLLEAWTLLAQDDLAFQLPVSEKKTLEGIFNDVAPGVQIKRAPEFDDDGAKVWALNPDKDVLALVYEKGDSVWIDVADYSPGQSGSEVYNAVANYAYNTGKTFIGDPAGLSDKAMARRLENMISSSLKFGTTNHLRPHEKQERGGAGVPPINWRAGDDAHNLKEMINASYHATLNQFPEIQGMRYNPDTDQIEGIKDGKIYSPGALKKIAAGKRNSGIASGQPVTAGRKTLERAILTHTVSRATRQEQLNVLARLGMQSSERLAGILYSLGPANTQQTRPSGGFSVSGLQETPIIYGISIDSILRVWQDKMRPLLRTQKAIKESGNEISEAENAYLAEEAFHGKTENDLRKMRERYLEPMARKMADYRIEREELDMYLWAKHAKERNAQIAKINPDMPDGGSGMTNAQADQILDQAKREGKKLRLDDLADIVYQLLDEKRKIMRHSLADDSMIDSWNNTYQYYVPLKGRAVDDSGGSYPRVGRGFDIRGKESLRALGRRTKPESPTLHAIKDTTESIIRYRKNEVGNALLALVEANPNPEYWEAHDASNPDFERKLLKKQGKDVVGSAKVINKEDYFITKRDGKEYYIRIEDPLLMRAMKNMGPEKMNWVVRQLAKVSRFLSSMVTSYNPEFVLTNFSRDIQTAILNLQAEIDLHDGKAKGKQITAKMIKGIPSASRAVFASLRNKKLKGDLADWQKSFDDFRNDGANTGWFQLLDIEQQASELKDLMEMNKANVRGQFLKNKKRIGDFVSNINSAVENAIRLSVYKNAVDAGVTRKQAASLAKNLTVNFNRKGEVGASINALYMFFNASVQGTAAFARAVGTLKVDENGKRKLNVAQKAAIGIMIASYGLALLNRSAAGDDDDGENWWDKVPDYVKERNLVIMESLWGGEEGKYITIPLPYGYNIFNALATTTDSAINSNKGIGESAGAMVKAMMGAFSPIGVAESNSFAGAATRTLAPTAFKPLADLAANENFFGSKVYQENFEFGVKKPQSHLHLRSTNDFWVWASEFLNDSTGGSPYRSGLIDVSPDKMGYIFNYFVGGAGQFYSRLVHLGIKGAEDREIKATEIPFVRRFTGEVNWYADQQKFYERKEKIDQVVAELRKLPTNSSERKSFKEEHRKLIELSYISNSVKNALADLRKQRNKILDDEELSEKEKEEKLKPLDLKMKTQVDRFNAAYLKKHQG